MPEAAEVCCSRDVGRVQDNVQASVAPDTPRCNNVCSNNNYTEPLSSSSDTKWKNHIHVKNVIPQVGHN